MTDLAGATSLDDEISQMLAMNIERVDTHRKVCNGGTWLILKGVEDASDKLAEKILRDVGIIKADGDLGTETNTTDLVDGSGDKGSTPQAILDAAEGGNIEPNTESDTQMGDQPAPNLDGHVDNVLKAPKPDDDGNVGCPTCDGDGKILGGNRKCPDCQGSGKISADRWDDVAKAAACVNGLGPQWAALSAMPLDIRVWLSEVGAMPSEAMFTPVLKAAAEIVLVNGKTLDLPDEVVGLAEETIIKAEESTKTQNDLPDSAFAYIEPGGKKDEEGKTTPRSKRHFPVHDEAHARNALARAPQSPFGDKAMPKIKAAAKKFGIDVSDGDVKKADGADGGDTLPGSSQWEAEDAAALRTAATQLAELATKLKSSADREATEYQAGAENSMSDVWDLQDATSALQFALGIVAALAFSEAQESADAASSEGEGVIAKAGKRLSAKSVDAIKTALGAAKNAHDKLTDLLGEAGSTDEDQEVDVQKAELMEALAGFKEDILKSVSDLVGEKPADDTTIAKGAGDGTSATDASTNGNGSTAAATDDKKGVADAESILKAAQDAIRDAATQGAASAVEAALQPEGTVGLILKSISDRVDNVEKQPVHSGPLSSASGHPGGSFAEFLALRGQANGSTDIDEMFKAAAEATDPQERERLSQLASVEALKAVVGARGVLPAAR